MLGRVKRLLDICDLNLIFKVRPEYYEMSNFDQNRVSACSLCTKQ